LQVIGSLVKKSLDWGIMKFKINQIIAVKDKTYVLSKSLTPSANFRLSETCSLGGFDIENWFDIPKASDENNIQRNSIVAFVLKNDRDAESISVNDILDLLDRFVRVVESFYTVSGEIYAVLSCGTGILEIGTRLVSVKEKKWIIVKNGFIIGRQKDEKLQRQVADNLWFQYKLQPIDHNEKPAIGETLRVIAPLT